MEGLSGRGRDWVLRLGVGCEEERGKISNDHGRSCNQQVPSLPLDEPS